MIISRTPLRITLGGGGTDDPAYLADHDGLALTAAISKHIYVSVNHRFDDGYLLKYAETERADTVEDVKHPIIREALSVYHVPPNIEIVSMADIPAGTGLGSSGAFTVGLCKALSTYMGSQISRADAAEMAAYIELSLLQRPGGKQDHWASALGGLNSLGFQGDGHVTARRLPFGPLTLKSLERSLRLFFTGYSRDADSILSTQTTDGLDDIKDAARVANDLLSIGDLQGFGHLMNDHWRLKQLRSKGMSNDHIDSLYDHALCNGAIGGKLVGAGGGGFLLFVADDADRLTSAMRDKGLSEVPFAFDHVGSTLIAQ